MVGRWGGICVRDCLLFSFLGVIFLFMVQQESQRLIKWTLLFFFFFVFFSWIPDSWLTEIQFPKTHQVNSYEGYWEISTRLPSPNLELLNFEPAFLINSLVLSVTLSVLLFSFLIIQYHLLGLLYSSVTFSKLDVCGLTCFSRKCSAPHITCLCQCP